jgi:hypothetical protein
MTEKKGAGGLPGDYRTEKIEQSLYDLESDPAESKNVTAEHPDVVERLTRLADAARKDIAEAPPPAGSRVDAPVPAGR